ncbi:MAG: CinA family protein [Campylobacterota bacterium]
MKKNILLIIGNAAVANNPFYQYILRCVDTEVDYLDEIININSNKLLITLEKLFESECNLIIITSPNTFATVSKVLATILADKLELKSQMLIPSLTKYYEKDSYLLEVQNSQVNVINASALHQLPPILIESKNETILNIFDLDTESIEILIQPLTKSFEIDLSYTKLTHDWVQVTCTSKKHGEINHFITSAKKLFLGKVVGSKNIFQYLIKRLYQNDKTLTLAESCTGGLIAANLTAQSGASAVLKGSLVTYSNDIKHEWLGVDREIFENFGAVSKECVQQMASGAIDIAKADYSIAVSGIAGPGGATEYKPVGTVIIGVGMKKEDKIETIVKEFHFLGDRNYIQQQTLYSGLKMLLISDKNLFL